jgi:hypothetical protein
MLRADFEWHGKEYSFEQKSADWYWSLGIIAAALAIVCILFGNILLALVVAAGAVAIGLEAAKHPRLHRFALTDQGLVIDDALYAYDGMMSYTVVEYLDGSLPPAISIKTTGILTPHLTVPLPGVDADAVYEYMYARVPHEPHEPPLSERLIALFRF